MSQVNAVDDANKADTTGSTSTINSNSNGEQASNTKEPSEKQQRKRMRVPTSCSVCRKRKIRCDKQKPICGGCAKSNVGHLCHYEEPSWVSSEELLKYSKQAYRDTSKNIINNSNANNHSEQPSDLINKQKVTDFTPYSSRSSDASPQANVINGFNVAELTPKARKVFDELAFRVKHLEASIAVHDLSNAPPSVPISNPNQSIPQGYINQDFNPNTAQAPILPFPNSNYYPQQASQPPFQQILPQSFPVHAVQSNNIQPHTSKTDHESEIDKNSPAYGFDPNERVKFNDYLPFIVKKTRLESHGPFSIISVMRRDVYLKVLWVHIWKKFERLHNEANSEGDTAACFNAVLNNNLLLKDLKGLTGFFEIRKNKFEEKALAKKALKENTDLNTLILNALPSRKVMMILVYRFFKNVYPMLPFLNESIFLSEINTLIGHLGYSDEKITQLHTTFKYDYSTLGLLLVVLRLAYITITDKEFEERKDFKILKNNPVKSSVVSIAVKCLSTYNYTRKSYSLKIVQLLLYIRLYYRYCTEDDDPSDGAESQTLLGSLFSMAFNLGLNRDPLYLTKLTSLPKRKPQAQVWRRIWHALLDLDAFQSVNVGLPLNCYNDNLYDTALPLFDPNDDDIDRFVSEDFKLLDAKTKLFREVNHLVMSLKKDPTVLEIIRMIKKLELFTFEHLGTFKSILSDHELKSYAKVKRVSYILEIYSILLSLNLQLLDHFERSQNIKQIFFYSEQCLKVSLKITNSLMNLVYNQTSYFEPGFAYYIRPVASVAISKSLLLISSLNIRSLQCHKLISVSDKNRANLFKKFSDVLFYHTENTLQLYAKIGGRHFNASRVVAAFRLFHAQMKDQLFDFGKAAAEATTLAKDSEDGNLQLFHLHDLKVTEVPKSNFLAAFLDQEIAHLTSKSQSDLRRVLKPLVSPAQTAAAGGVNATNNTTATTSAAPAPPPPTHSSRPSHSSQKSTSETNKIINSPLVNNSQNINNPTNGLNPVQFSNTHTSAHAPPGHVSTPSSYNDDSPINIASINSENIFGFNTSTSDITNDTTNNHNRFNISNDPIGSNLLDKSLNQLSGEEYASLFGLFEDYNIDFGGAGNI